LSETWGYGGDGYRIVSELFASDSQNQSAIDPSGEGDEDTLEIVDDF
tara:strand:- start:196 stop:336 length:141 start_codon:yes stop_codon:yes gene_type:complete